MNIGVGTLKTATTAAAAAYLGPAVLGGKKAAFLKALSNKKKGAKSFGQGSQAGKGSSSNLKNQDSNFVPEGFSAQPSSAAGFQDQVASKLNNPYQEETTEAKVFDHMRGLGYNPYSENDQKRFESKHLKTNKSHYTPAFKNAYGNLKDHSRTFAQRKAKQKQLQRRNQVMKDIQRMAQRHQEEEERQEREKKKQRSLIRRTARYFRDKSRGDS